MVGSSIFNFITFFILLEKITPSWTISRRFDFFAALERHSCQICFVCVMGLRHVGTRIVASSRQIVNDRLEEFCAPGLLLLLQQHTRFFTRNKVSNTVWDSQYVVASNPSPNLMLVRVDDERFRSVQWSSRKSFGAISLEPSPSPPPLHHHHHHHHEQPPALPESSEQVPVEPASTSAPIEGSHRSSVDAAETAKFAAIAATWWDYQGPFKPLHIMNQIRISFIRSAICRHFRKDANSARPLEGLQIVDVGCGGGLLCEPLARMGGLITGIDAVEKNLGVASLHAARDPATASIKYLCTTAEQMVHEQEKFDVVIALEVIEHVADPMEFCKSLAALTKKNGIVFISTLNRSIQSFGLAIVAAEYVLGWLPQGTHNWSKFVTPEELALLMGKASLSVEEMAGMVYNPFSQKWSLSEDTSVNYIALGVKRDT